MDEDRDEARASATPRPRPEEDAFYSEELADCALIAEQDALLDAEEEAAAQDDPDLDTYFALSASDRRDCFPRLTAELDRLFPGGFAYDDDLETAYRAFLERGELPEDEDVDRLEAVQEEPPNLWEEWLNGRLPDSTESSAGPPPP